MSGMVLRSPVSGRRLVRDAAHSLADGAGERWPVVDGIAYLRTGRADLVRDALRRLDRGDGAGALLILLTDQDDWWTGPKPSPEALADLVANRDRLSLREAMDRLAFGRVADYFAHRWSDPTFLAGLGLLEAHWRPAASAFELGCGIGHYGRELLLRGVAYTGADVVFAKVWLARRWVAGPEAQLLCFDAAAPWPTADGSFDLALCQDAFYFLEPKAAILARLSAAIVPSGWMAIGHIHNSDAPNWSPGNAVGVDDLGSFFPDGVFYDDAELTAALVEVRAPRPQLPRDLRAAEAFAVADGPGLSRSPRILEGGFALPVAAEGRLRLNPLYQPCKTSRPEPPGAARGSGATFEIAWPSARYRDEYRVLATYPTAFTVGETPEALASAIRRRALVDLPERW